MKTRREHRHQHRGGLSKESEQRKQLQEFRSQNQKLRRENARLRREIEKLRASRDSILWEDPS